MRTPNTQRAAAHTPGTTASGELIVFLRNGKTSTELLHDLAMENFRFLDNGRCLSKSWNAWLLRFDTQTDMNAALQKTRNNPSVILAQFNHYLEQRNTTPNDAVFPNQWNMLNTGQNSGTPDADIDADEAWDITTGGLTVAGDTIVVAVVDGGFDLNHEDLNFWKNYAEVNNTDSIDDDGNGYVDDHDGWNAYDHNGVISVDNHGTHVSGIVGAKGNDTVGVAGVNWGVKIMPVMGSTTVESEAVEAYSYVFDARKLYNTSNGTAGAFVVSTNSSFGVDQGQPAQFPIWCAMYDSLGSVGILNACATANHNWDIDAIGDIPTSCASPYMISVTNMNRLDQKYMYAGFGDTTIDIGAPGTAIYSTLPNNQYAGQSWSGTSMATPHVAGAIALMYAAACPQLIAAYKTNPAQVALDMRNYLLNGVDTLQALNGLVATNGRLNLYKALLQVQYNCPNGMAEQTNTAPSIENIFPNPSTGRFTIQYNAPGETAATISVTNMLGQEVWRSQRSCNGGVNVQLLDLSGISGGVYFVRISCGALLSSVQRVIVK